MRYAMVLGVTLASFGAAAEERWTAPYQIEAVSGRTTRVVLGEQAPEDVDSRLQVMTLVGTQGMAVARFQGTEPVCTGDEDSELPPVCHTVGVYTQASGAPDLGEQLVALAGTVAGTVSLPAPRTAQERPVPGQWTSDAFETPVDEGARPFTPEGYPVPGYRWHTSPEGHVTLETNHGGQRGDPRVPLDTCTQERQGPFTRLECYPGTPPFAVEGTPGASLLYVDRRPLVVSFADYGEATTALVATLRVGGDTQYLVRVGLKGQAVTGLLFREGNAWRLLLRPADYPVLGC
ncbi:hypothetical protein [Corallococcus macrosporus]|uniref:Lipoprotein n=1 Tax=Myxococcus fulvus (strain ATCC BAA-855 / HW-1) TaxID=483219 RepID=F8C8R8_MYXFH|nr:hypothetical protein [Corallococcus macrosporus]AEI63215.1 hypothetical protein LILAB_06480 [Corallococcus macrosporus]